MATFININKLATANTKPIISGKASFTRFNSLGNPDQSIEIILNYRPYYLFEGQLGLSETSIPGVYDWKLHIDAPLYPGTYDVEANIYNVADDLIVASDDSVNEVTILDPARLYGGQPAPAPKKSLAQKVATVAALMNALSNLFGNSGVGGASPSVHPVQDDQSSSSLVGRGNEEREEDLRVKSKDKVVDKAPLPPKKHNFDVTGEANAADPNDLGKMELGSLDDARKDLGEAAQLQDDTKNIIDQQNTIQGTGELAVGSAFG
jgi:hypothetical protein